LKGAVGQHPQEIILSQRRACAPRIHFAQKYSLFRAKNFYFQE
jgi:hypothetical protein